MEIVHHSLGLNGPADLSKTLKTPSKRGQLELPMLSGLTIDAQELKDEYVCT